MGFEVLRMAAPAVVVFHAGLNLLSKQRRQVMLGATEKLEKNDLGTVTGQLEAAQKEAELLNNEYDRKEQVNKNAVSSFEEFVKKINEK